VPRKPSLTQTVRASPLPIVFAHRRDYIVCNPTL
jgi:hypothetical protein